jgi:hypothetical protein
MKTLIAVCLLAVSTVAFAEPQAAAPNTAQGVVLDAKDVNGYTYLQLKTSSGETWAAIPQTPVKKGDTVTLVDVMVMHDFPSKTLNKTFPTILFGTLASGRAQSPHVVAEAASAAGPVTGVTKATGKNARTVADVVGNAAGLKGQTVQVRGKVVKYNSGIMGRNWIHLADGSGSAANRTNDILVTSMEPAKVGDVLTAQGVVETAKDFGAGYYYNVLIENATLTR